MSDYEKLKEKYNKLMKHYQDLRTIFNQIISNNDKNNTLLKRALRKDIEYGAETQNEKEEEK